MVYDDRGPREDKYVKKLVYVFCKGIHIIKSGYGIVEQYTVARNAGKRKRKRSKSIKEWCVEQKRICR